MYVNLSATTGEIDGVISPQEHLTPAPASGECHPMAGQA
jgi:hypothetical protein